MSDVTNISNVLMLFFQWFIILYTAIAIIFSAIFLIFSFFQIRKEYKIDKHKETDQYLFDYFTKPVSIIVPAFNEEAGIIESVRSLLSLSYPEIEIIVVNDGSTDGTLQVVMEQFQMKKIEKEVLKQIDCQEINGIYQSVIFSHLILVDKVNGGKADALNAGINISRCPYFCSIDGDSILEKEALLKIMRPVMKSNEEIIAIGGSVRIANGCNIELGSVLDVKLSKNPLVVMQVIEYLRSFLTGRIGLGHYNMLLILSGAFSVFSKKWAIEVGGYTKDIVGEDMEIVVKLHKLIRKKKLKKRIKFVADSICWTEAPETLKAMQKQRSRWHRGLLESLWKHKGMTFNPRYGLVGMISFPYYWFIELLGPVIELSGYVFVILAISLEILSMEFAISLLLLMAIYGALFSVTSFLLGMWSMNQYVRAGEIARLLGYALFEWIWYRPLTVIWRCWGIVQYVFNHRGWDKGERKGVAKV